MKQLKVTEIYKIGPRKVAKLGNNQVAIYLPRSFVFLRGKKVMVTIEVLEEEEQ